MPKPLVVVTRPFQGDGLKRIAAKARVKIWDKGRKITDAELLKFVKGATAIVPMLTEKINDKVLSAAGSQLKIVANYAVGFDNLDLKALSGRKVFATNTPGILTESVAEHAMMLILAASRRVVEADEFLRHGKYEHWEPSLFLGQQLYQKKLGVVGLGRIGTYLAQMAYSGFHMDILYYDVARNPQFEEMFEAKFRRFETLIKEADVISVHVPLLPSTFHLFSKKEFKAMKNTAVFVNTSRGPIVDEKALGQAVKDGQIAAAGIDVLEFEPKLAPGLSKLERVVMTPHIASATIEARSQMSAMVADNVLSVLNGEKPRDVIPAAPPAPAAKK